MNGWRRVAFPLLTVTLLAAGCAGLPAADRPSRLPIGHGRLSLACFACTDR